MIHRYFWFDHCAGNTCTATTCRHLVHLQPLDQFKIIGDANTFRSPINHYNNHFKYYILLYKIPYIVIRLFGHLIYLFLAIEEYIQAKLQSLNAATCDMNSSPNMFKQSKDALPLTLPLSQRLSQNLATWLLSRNHPLVHPILQPPHLQVPSLV